MKLWLAKVTPEEKDKLKLQLAGYGIGSAPAPVVTEEPT